MSYQKVIKETIKVFKHLTDSEAKNSTELSLLAGHLLIESALKALLEKSLVEPSAVKLDRLMFAQTMNWARAVLGDSEVTWQWEAMTKLNKLRNSFAHDLEKQDFAIKINEYIEFVKDHHSLEYYQTSFSKEEELVWAITSTHTGLMGVLQK